MLRVHYSNRFEELTAWLADDLARTRADVLTPVSVVVPNQAVAACAKLAIARRRGIAASLAFPFLESLLAGCLSPDSGLAILDKPKLQVLLCALLDDRTALAAPAMAPVRGYLLAAGDDPDAVDLRRFQLADALSTLFVEYGASRPELLAAWHGDRPPPDADAWSRGWRETERWQRHLWQRLMGPEGPVAQLAADGRRWLTLPQLFAEHGAEALTLPPRLYLLGFSYLARGYHRVLSALGQHTELSILALNPCMEFWEDVPATWEARLRGRSLARRGARAEQSCPVPGGADAILADENPLLVSWGRPGRDNIRLLDELSDCDFEAHFVDPAARGATLLARVQRDVLLRRPPGDDDPDDDRSASDVPDDGRNASDDPDDGRNASDDSVQILACPSIRRELEIIAGEIWRRTSSDPSLRLCDIAVLLGRADAEAYQAHLAAVFGEVHALPYHLVDIPLAGESRVVEALQMLLELPLGNFTRPELLGLLTHPAVLARYPDVEPGDWIRWSERLGIVHGADRTDHAGTYIDRDVYNWDQGVKRLALGAFMAAERSGQADAVVLGDTPYVPEELTASELPSAARFALLARSLIADARFCRHARLPLSQWRLFFDHLCTSYLAAADGADERVLARCRDAVASLADHDLDGRPVSFRIASQLASTQLAALRGARGELLADGVTVAPLAPMRALPYRVVFVAGLGAGRFPTADRESPLDLRQARRLPGDVSAMERDRYVFLETLLAARDALVLSYVARDEVSGEILEPSSVIVELSGLIARMGVDPDTLTACHPLRGWDARYQGELPQVSPAALRQRRAAALRADLEAHLRARGLEAPDYDTTRKALDALPSLAPVRALLGLPTLTGLPAPPEPGASLVVPLQLLRRFLESPLQAWASRVLGLREVELDDPVMTADESFEGEFLQGLLLVRAAFAAFLIDDDIRRGGLDALVACYRERADRARMSGAAPIGLFSRIAEAKQLATLELWYQGLDEVPGAARVHAFGGGARAEHPLIEHPPIVFDARVRGADVRIELSGRTELVTSDAGSLILTPGRRWGPKHVIRAFVDHLALSAAALSSGPHAARVLTTSGGQQHRFGVLPASEAIDYLRALIADIFDDTHEYLLPCEAVFAYHDRPEQPLAQQVRKLTRNAAKNGFGTSDFLGPVSTPALLEPPADAEARAERRFAALFGRWEPPPRSRGKG